MILSDAEFCLDEWLLLCREVAEGASLFYLKNFMKIRTSFPWEENRHVLTNQSTKNRIVQSLKSNILLLLVVWTKTSTEEELVSIWVFRRFLLLLLVVVLDLVLCFYFVSSGLIPFIYQSILVAFWSGKMGEAE